MKTMRTNFARGVSILASLKPKYAAIATASMLGVVLSVSDASAFTCVRGVYRAACASPYGAVGIGPNGAVAVGRYGNVYAYRRGSGCFWRNGQRICL
ncbi:hypothetical protein J6524_31250 [Bradyrhizobium sp. WSM 1738]|uniref:hypothetical protein n=1 Tax=Bradyrhizobium hereditatis TaxID=2821405 RepID=UPI001CE39626|nr:hypothetical protein [Bradyrhizobium hereditatis]MCA6119316.1 hypothetical protein [Bradyrhizobium hereditatis]